MLEKVFRSHSPEVVFHLAAEKFLHIAQQDPWHAVETNVLGTQNVVECAVRHKAERFVSVSTRKSTNVFPDSVLGQTKRLGEFIVQAAAKRSRTYFGIVRLVHTLETDGSYVMQVFKRQIEKGELLTLTDPEIMNLFQNKQEAVAFILNAGVYAEEGEIFGLSNLGFPVKTIAVARFLLRKAGRDPSDIKIIGLREGETLCYGRADPYSSSATLNSFERIESRLLPDMSQGSPMGIVPEALKNAINQLKSESIAVSGSSRLKQTLLSLIGEMFIAHILESGNSVKDKINLNFGGDVCKNSVFIEDVSEAGKIFKKLPGDFFNVEVVNEKQFIDPSFKEFLGPLRSNCIASRPGKDSRTLYVYHFLGQEEKDLEALFEIAGKKKREEPISVFVVYCPQHLFMNPPAIFHGLSPDRIDAIIMSPCRFFVQPPDTLLQKSRPGIIFVNEQHAQYIKPANMGFGLNELRQSASRNCSSAAIKELNSRASKLDFILRLSLPWLSSIIS